MANEQDVAAHYRHGDLEAALLVGLAAMGRDPERLTPAEMNGADEFHVGGGAATEALAAQLGVTGAMRLLDLGSGIGGPARHLAATYGCHVTGIELSGEYAAVANSLSRRMGLAARTDFQQGSATALPFADGSFDGATLLHVGMNIADKAALCAGVFRVLRPGGFFAVYDVMRAGPGKITFPVPWSSAAATSFVETPEVYRAALTGAGFTIATETSRAERAQAFFAAMRARQAASTPLGLQIVMGPAAAEKLANMIGLITRGVIAPVEMIARK